jgi:chloride channel protein, CIC family
VLSAVTGILAGLVVAAFDWFTADQLLGWVRGLPAGAQAAAPCAGLVLCALALRFLGRGASPATSDEYIRNLHQPNRRLDLRKVPARVLGSVATLGMGGALGLEGPSIYMGAATGSALQRRFPRLFSPRAGKTLLVAGAAAGVSAIFKAPATGTVFALEVPYQDDTAQRMLLPALVASATSYLTFVAINGTEPLFPTGGSPPFATRELGGALLLGVLCGVLARLFTWTTGLAKRFQQRLPAAVGVVAAGSSLAGLFALSRLVVGEDLTIGPGYQVIDWLRDTPSLWLVTLVLVLRVAATALTIAGGGAGGLFVPLVLLGALTGQLVGGALDEPSLALFPLVGVAAFLGAGYRTPLAAVMFVAESTGRPGFVVPGLLAAATSQFVMGRASVSAYQETGRVGHLEQRFQLPIRTAVQTDTPTAPPTTSLHDAVWGLLMTNRKTTVCVVDATTYLGLLRLDDIAAIPHERWTTTPTTEVMRTDIPPATPDWTVADAVEAMQTTDLDILPVVDHDGTFAGIVTLADTIRLDQILHSVTHDRLPPVRPE